MKEASDAQMLPAEIMPLIDLGPWFRDAAGRARVAVQVRQACHEHGFFYIKNHGVPPETIAAVFRAADDFFRLDEAAKMRVHYGRTGELRGYIPLRGEGMDSAPGGDWKEAFDCAPEYDPPAAIDSTARPAYWDRMYARNPWPEELGGFRQAVETYMAALTQLGRALFGVFAASVGLPADYFRDQLDRPIAEVRLLRYPPTVEDGSVGIGAHCDAESFTILAENEVGGIQVRDRDGDWVLARSIPGTFVVLLGEMLARWTNDVFVATPHRVISTRDGVRYSIPFFFGPNFDSQIATLPTCQGPDRPARYAPVVAGEYLVERLAGNYGDQPRVA